VGNRSPHPDRENRDASDPRMLPEPAAFLDTNLLMSSSALGTSLEHESFVLVKVLCLR
jgi:hypothetical protein